MDQLLPTVREVAMSPSPVVTLSRLAPQTQTHGDSFEAHLAAVAAPAGARRLGARLVEVPPGKKAWPYHCHHANDEMFVILSGRGELRFGGEVYPCAAGAVVGCPSGGPETAHTLTASGPAPLRYLPLTPMTDPES